MSSPEQKAKELVSKFLEFTPAEEEYELPYAKACALICVEEIINSRPTQPANTYPKKPMIDIIDDADEYYQKVKEEIQKL